MRTSSHRTTGRIDPKLYDRGTDLARYLGVSFNVIMNRVLSLYLELADAERMRVWADELGSSELETNIDFARLAQARVVRDSER